MGTRHSENGNRPITSMPPREKFSASDFKLEFILTAVMLLFAASVYIVLSVMGITSGLKEMCPGLAEKTPDQPAAAAVSTPVSGTDVSGSDTSGTDADSAAPTDMGLKTLLVYHTAVLVPDTEQCSSYTSSDEAVATVDNSGNVTPVAMGSADITGKASSGSTYVWHVNVRKVAYLMFSDFPNEYTGKILDVLKEKNIKATFFVCLRSKEEYFPYYRRIIDEGHTIGNHTSSHDMDELLKSTDDFKNSIIKLENYLDLNFSCRTKFVSIPNGTGTKEQNNVVTKVTTELHDKGYTLVDWTLEVGDYKEITRDDILNNIKNRAKGDREIISMHNYIETAKALPKIITYLQEQGYEFEAIADAPDVYNQYYGWETNINRRGAGTSTEEMLSGFHYKPQ